MHPIVDTVCVYADPEKTCTVALIIPAEGKLMDFRDQLCLSNNISMTDLCKNETLVDLVLKDVMATAKNGLERFEIPQQIKVW